MARIKIRISKDGTKVRVEPVDVMGASCTSLTEGIENALGSRTEQELKDEFYAEEEQEREELHG